MKTIIIALALLVATSANAVDFEVSAGQTFYTQSNNTIYWQDGRADQGFWNNFQLNPAFASIGIVDGNNRYGYARLGKASMSSNTTNQDAQYNTTTHTCNPGCQMNTWMGWSSSDGLYATHLFRDSSGLFAEAGAWAYRTTLFAEVNGPATDGAWQLPTHTTYGIGPVMGIGYEVGKWSVAATSYYVRRYSDMPAIYKPWAAVVSVRYKF